MNKKKSIYQISRRNFLRGMGLLGAISVPLPLFDFMLNGKGTAYASGNALPQRFLIMKSGNVPTMDGDVGAYDLTGRGRNLLCPLTPGDGNGVGYTLSESTQSIASTKGLQSYMGFFAGCDIPHVNTNPMGLTGVPAGGYCGYTHESGRVLATGRRIGIVLDDATDYHYEIDLGPSADQLLKAQLNPNNQFVHANYTLVPFDDAWRHSLQYDVSGNLLLPNYSPESMWHELFADFVQPGTMPDPAAGAELMKRKSILDQLDKDGVNFLKRELSANDKSVLNTHFDMLRSLEQRIANTTPGTVAASCMTPGDPGPDATDLPTRGKLITDLLAMAFACDRVRHGTYQMTNDQCLQVDSSFVSGFPVSFHQMTHSYGDDYLEGQKKTVGFVFDQFVQLAAALQATPEGTGNVLDNTVIVYHSEAGAGQGTDIGPPVRAHSHIDHCVVVAGKVGGIKTGSFTDCSKLGPNGGPVHPSAITLAAMKAVGYSGNALGDVNQPFSGLWSGA